MMMAMDGGAVVGDIVATMFNAGTKVQSPLLSVIKRNRAILFLLAIGSI